VGYDAAPDNMGLHLFVQQLLPAKSTKSREILRKFELIAVRGHPRSNGTQSIDDSTLSHIKPSEVRTQQFESYRVNHILTLTTLFPQSNRLYDVVSSPLTLKPKKPKKNLKKLKNLKQIL